MHITQVKNDAKEIIPLTSILLVLVPRWVNISWRRLSGNSCCSESLASKSFLVLYNTGSIFLTVLMSGTAIHWACISSTFDTNCPSLRFEFRPQLWEKLTHSDFFYCKEMPLVLQVIKYYFKYFPWYNWTNGIKIDYCLLSCRTPSTHCFSRPASSFISPFRRSEYRLV